MELILYAKAFLVGGLLCAFGQLLLSLTRLTTARILVIYVTAGVVLGGLGLYESVVDWAGAGATVPLTGFGCALANGAREAVADDVLFCVYFRFTPMPYASPSSDVTLIVPVDAPDTATDCVPVPLS